MSGGGTERSAAALVVVLLVCGCVWGCEGGRGRCLPVVAAAAAAQHHPRSREMRSATRILPAQEGNSMRARSPSLIFLDDAGVCSQPRTPFYTQESSSGNDWEARTKSFENIDLHTHTLYSTPLSPPLLRLQIYTKQAHVPIRSRSIPRRPPKAKRVQAPLVPPFSHGNAQEPPESSPISPVARCMRNRCNARCLASLGVSFVRSRKLRVCHTTIRRLCLYAPRFTCVFILRSP